MIERGILFKDRLVRRILAGAKTQTRRIAKLPADVGEVRIDPGGTALFGPGPYIKAYGSEVGGHAQMYPRIRCPYGYPGDRLWVREAWRSWTRSCADEDTDDDHECSAHCNQTYVAYRATPRTGFRPVPDRAAITYLDESTPIESNRDLIGPWKPGIHLRRDWARIWLDIVAVRVERLQDISEADALAEGVVSGRIPADENGPERSGYVLAHDDGQCTLYPSAREAFAAGWCSINGAESWASNPWVWVVEFKRAEAR